MHVAAAVADGDAIENSVRTTFFWLQAAHTQCQGRKQWNWIVNISIGRIVVSAHEAYRQQASTAIKSTNNDIESIALTTHLQINVHQGQIARRSRVTSHSTQLWVCVGMVLTIWRLTTTPPHWCRLPKMYVNCWRLTVAWRRHRHWRSGQHILLVSIRVGGYSNSQHLQLLRSLMHQRCRHCLCASRQSGVLWCECWQKKKKNSLPAQRQRAQQMLEFNTFYRILNVYNLSSQNPYSFQSRHSQKHKAANVNLTDAKCRGDPVNSLNCSTHRCTLLCRTAPARRVASLVFGVHQVSTLNSLLHSNAWFFG
jgi:hypothetical protein